MGRVATAAERVKNVKIPAKLFKDMAPTGALMRILLLCFEWRLQHGVSDWNFDAHHKQRNLEMIKYIKSNLEKEGFYKAPRVAFVGLDAPTRTSLQQLLQSLNGTYFLAEN